MMTASSHGTEPGPSLALPFPSQDLVALGHSPLIQRTRNKILEPILLNQPRQRDILILVVVVVLLWVKREG